MMSKAVLIVLSGLVVAQAQLSGFDTGCYEESDKGKSYRGLVTSTSSGRACQKWTKDKPHTISMDPTTENGLGNHNYCRNPDGSEDKPWCFTMDPSPDKEKETCEVPKCPGMARDFKDEADGLATKMAPSFDCACLATLHKLQAGASLLQLAKSGELSTLVKTNTTAMVKGKVVNGKCVCK
eukprot:gnl/MRDRNA2_/MRDRNA2_88955_c0_seq1.p1 gnl/MRDRNA2_/MRDRNA2_88955_c0~~gnl/MRDRNA2_/MRDRNA2_88955_c0_seq1.p1  ORF type:complete len:181 (-),score=37.81 gnl/MRDRNA2_/MRDRNA2_88955_c0_seq1:195-737(-)